jgi:Glycosyltransferase family 87
LKITFSNWVTAPRLTAHAVLLAACIWAVYACNMSVPGLFDRNGLIKGADFLHFYILGSLAANHGGDLLYDMRGQSEFLSQLLPEARKYVYVPLYGPQVSVLLSPLARLSYLQALTAWLVLNTVLYAICCFSLWRCASDLKPYPWTVVFAAIAFPGFFHLIVWGQTSGLALICFVLAYLALRSKHDFLAGLAIGSLIFKPQLGIAAAVLFLATKRWKLISGAVIAASLQLSIGWLYYGTDVMQRYWHTLLNVSRIVGIFEPRPYQTHSLRTFFSMLIPIAPLAFVLYMVSAAIVMYVLVQCWRRQTELDIAYSTLLLATVLVSPHLTVYDLVILVPVFLLLSNTVVQKRSGRATAVKYLLYALFPLFLAGPLARLTHLQLAVVAMAALFWISRDLVRDRAMQV